MIWTFLYFRSGTNTLGIIFFCLTFGTVLGSLGKKAQLVVDFFKVIDEVIMKMVNAIMWISPVGISSVICAKILGVTQLGSMMSQLGLFIFTVCSGIFIYQFTFLQVNKKLLWLELIDNFNHHRLSTLSLSARILSSSGGDFFKLGWQLLQQLQRKTLFYAYIIY